MEARRRQLIDAALRVFADHGFNGATTRQIAVAAGVTEAVIFQHFADKHALYSAILESKAADPWAARWFEELEQHRRAGDDVALLRALFAGVMDQHERDPDFLRLMMYSALEHHPVAPRLSGRSTHIYLFLERFIRDGQRDGRFQPGPPAVLVRAVLALPIYHTFQIRLLKTPWPTVSREALIDTGVAFALAGLAARSTSEEVRS
jgi:AcrR family transcriptional regulator